MSFSHTPQLKTALRPVLWAVLLLMLLALGSIVANLDLLGFARASLWNTVFITTAATSFLVTLVLMGLGRHVSEAVKAKVAVAGLGAALVLGAAMAWQKEADDLKGARDSLYVVSGERDGLRRELSVIRISADTLQSQVNALQIRLSEARMRQKEPVLAAQGLRGHAEDISAPNEGLAAKKIVITSNAPVQPVALVLKCDEIIVEGECEIGGSTGEGWGCFPVPYDSTQFMVQFTAPPLTPERPLVVKLIARRYFTVRELLRVKWSHNFLLDAQGKKP